MSTHVFQSEMLNQKEKKKKKKVKTKDMLPGHSLNKTFTKMVIGDGHLHLLVPCVGVTVAQQHNLVYSK